MSTINLTIAGDLFPGRRVEPIAKENPAALFDQRLLDLFRGSDFNIVNLECPLTEAGKESQIIKTGPHLKASPATAGVLGVIQTHLVTLANNHIYDYGEKGLVDTLSVCDREHISTVGAGPDLAAANRVFRQKIGETRIAVVNIAENEWSNANGKHGGANPLDIAANTLSIQDAKRDADIVILIIHGGHEYYHYPSPRMVALYRYYATQGASIVVSHHSHFISGYEEYGGVPIFYGLGNFLFDSTTDQQGWYTGLLLSLQIGPAKEIRWALHPVSQCKGQIKVELLQGSEKAAVEQQLREINEVISDPAKLRARFEEFIISQKDYILSMFSTSWFFGHRYVRSAIRKVGLERFFLRKAQLKSIWNYSNCEAHRDITFETITNYLNAR